MKTLKAVLWAGVSIVLVLATACAGSAEPQVSSPRLVTTEQVSPTAPAEAGATAAPAEATAETTAEATPEATVEANVEPTAEAAGEATAAPESTAPVTETTSASQVPDSAPNLALQTVVEGLAGLTYLTHAGDGSGRLYVTEQPGRVKVIENGQARDILFLDITDRVGSQGNEQGLLSIVFSPDFATDHLAYVNYTDGQGDTVVSRFTVSADGLTADPDSEQVILTVDQPFPNHNGGQLKFGPDGMFYIGMGDGGSAGDPRNNGQDVTSLLGKMLRIDVRQPGSDGKPYSIPADNPDFGPDAAPELWAIGLRNPWRFSFDRATGDLYIADVGQNAYEEIDFQPAGQGGLNYGWRLREGFEPYNGGEDSPAFTPPIYQYGRELGCSVSGGYVYRGADVPGLVGRYVYADFCSGTIWALHRDAEGQWVNETLLETDLSITSFGEDEAGELYVLNRQGTISRIAAAE